MSKSNFKLSTAALAFGFALAVTVGYGVAFADEPPPDDFPPPAAPKTPPVKTPPVETPEGDTPEGEVPEVETPKVETPEVETPEVEAPEVEAPKGEDAWSPPAVTPGGTGSTLPPPQIIRRRGRGLPPKQPRPSGAMPTFDIPATNKPQRTPLIRDVAAERPGSVMPPAPALPGAATPPPPAPPKLPIKKVQPTAPTQPRLIPAARSGTRVIGVAKTHNVALSDGDLALQIDVDYDVRGQSGQDIYVGIWFVRKDTGKHIKAALTSYGDPTGFVTLQTRSSRVQTAAARFAATLRIPYRAFPVATGTDAYDVEARVQILRRESGTAVSALARGTTEFRVYGASDAK